MTVTLWNKTVPYYREDADTPNSMTLYLIGTNKPLPCIVIFPGGAYFGRAEHEGAPIAAFFNSQGIHAAVVDYRVYPNYFPAPLADAQRAIRIIRANAEAWGIDGNKIITCGFSAGGHLAASTILYDSIYSDDIESDEIDSFSCSPNGAILCYPVISVAHDYGNVHTGKNLLGNQRYETDHEKFCLTQYVTKKAPPVFLWHTSDDSGVNVKNSLIFAEKLRDHKIPFELHVFPNGPHGLGLAADYPDISKWAYLAADWVRRNI